MYEADIEIPNNVWEQDLIAKFQFNIENNKIPYNTYINVRHAHLYPKRNLWLFIKTINAEGKTHIDTFECMLADKAGKWYGNGMGDIWDVQIPYLKNVAFNTQGKYTVEIQQAMRYEKLPLVMKIGYRVEKGKLDE